MWDRAAQPIILASPSSFLTWFLTRIGFDPQIKDVIERPTSGLSH